MTTRADTLLARPSEPDGASARRLRVVRFAWGTLAYTVAVILFGAVVRITGSGAGCGQHWPTCQGEVVHLPKTLETAIEFTHRLTSGLSVLLVVALLVAVFRTFDRGHGARRAVSVSTAMMVVESLVGAALVLLGLVGKNASVARAGVMAVHLVSTSLLTGSLALTAFFAAGNKVRHFWPRCTLEWALFAGLLATVAVSVTGAFTALGDTLYPVDTTRALVERITADSAATSFLERGRAVHPVVAVLSAAFLLSLAWKTPDIRPYPAIFARASLLRGLVFTQVTAGVVNVALSAPPFVQVIHLAIATALWVTLVLFYATAMQPSSAT